MHPIRWITRGASSILDVGCNAGELLAFCRRVEPDARLVGVDINPVALAAARVAAPTALIARAEVHRLPLDADGLDVVACIEVLEHVPAPLRRDALGEMARVLRPGGRLILRVPHAGVFAWLDPGNARFRFPGLYRRLIAAGRRDAGYAGCASGVVWHHHFRHRELIDLLGSGWRIEAARGGGLFLLPLLDAATWPLQRLGLRTERLHRLADLDLGIDYGRLSYTWLIVASKVEPATPPQQ